MMAKFLGQFKNNAVNQLQMIAVVLSLASIFNLAMVYRQINRMTNDGRMINYAGILRGRTQRLIKLVLAEGQIENSNSSFQSDIKTITTELDQIFQGLQEGDTELRLIRVEDPTFQSQLEQLEQAWNQLKIAINDIDENATPEDRERLLQQSEAYWDLANEAVFTAEAFADRHVVQSKTLAVMLCGVSLLLLIVLLYISRTIQSRLKSTVINLGNSSSEIAATMQQQERIASQQAASVNETTTTMDELKASCRQSAEQAQASVAAAQQALQLAEEGTQAVGETLASMSAMQRKVEDIAEQIMRLNQQATQISGISQIVSELANQTNMLALNSSLEAKRAGEHGKGFVIVADEIRKLSEQSQQSVEKINALTSEIQRAVKSTVLVTDEGTQTVKASVKIAQRTEQAFSGVADAVNEVVLNNQQVLLNLKQQVDAIQQVVEAMAVINTGSKESVAGLTQTKIGTEQLKEAALVLREMV